MRAKTSWRPDCRDGQMIERRGTVRHAAGGEVVFFFADPEAVEIRGVLLDVSAGGFRAVHMHTELRAGQNVKFHHALANGLAQVVWNRIVGNRIESGFIVVNPDN
jgi:hypothetical protein